MFEPQRGDQTIELAKLDAAGDQPSCEGGMGHAKWGQRTQQQIDEYDRETVAQMRTDERVVT